MNLRKIFLYSLCVTAICSFNIQTNISHAQRMNHKESVVKTQDVISKPVLNTSDIDAINNN